MNCPLYEAAGYSLSAEDAAELDFSCDEFDCAWWIPSAECCAIRCLGEWFATGVKNQAGLGSKIDQYEDSH